MSKSFAVSSRESIDLFKKLIKGPLQELLQGSIFSVEDDGQAGSSIAKVMDQSAVSDLVVHYQENGAVFVAASRISYEEEQNCKLHRYPSPTLRNSVNGSYENTELNKLHKTVQLFESGIPILIPRYLCYARVFPKNNPTNLHDLIAIETIPFIKHCFSPSGLNLQALRIGYESRKKESEKLEEKEQKNISYLLDEKLPWAAGIRTKEDNTFLFVGKKYLELCGLPFLFRN